MQRVALKHGFVTLGLLLGWLPETTTASGVRPQRQPISALFMAHRLEAAPRTRSIALEGRDAERVAAAYDALEVPFHQGARGPRPRPLGARLELDGALRIAHLRLEVGAPPAPVDAALVERSRALGARILWADVPVEHPDAPLALAMLRAAGLGYACLVPIGGARGEDVLRLQLYLGEVPLRPEAILVVDSAAAIRDEVLEEAGLVEIVG
jgi:hypothetical protein